MPLALEVKTVQSSVALASAFGANFLSLSYLHFKPMCKSLLSQFDLMDSDGMGKSERELEMAWLKKSNDFMPFLGVESVKNKREPMQIFSNLMAWNGRKKDHFLHPI